jgi:hypothetical protein
MHRGELLQKAAEKTKAAIFDMEETFAAFFLLFSLLDPPQDESAMAGHTEKLTSFL